MRDQASQGSAASEVDAGNSKSQVRTDKHADEIAKLKAALRAGTKEQKKHALEVLLPALIKRDILAAAELVAGLDAGETRQEAAFDVAKKWGDSDPQAAFAWSCKLPGEEEQQNCVAIICQKLAYKDPVQAMALAESYTGPSRHSLIHGAIGPWMAQDPDAAITWIQRIESPKARDLCWTSAVDDLALKDPERAANLVLDHIGSNDLMEYAVIGVLSRWMVQDRQAATRWVDSFPPGNLRTRAENELKKGR